MRMRLGAFRHSFLGVVGIAALLSLATAAARAESAPAHMQLNATRPRPWPGGLIPYDLSKLTPAQQGKVLRAMQRWTDTGANIQFILRSNQTEYVFFTGKTDAGNNTSHTGYQPGAHTDINISAFWWRQAEWMPAHELGHVLGFPHEHQRWDRDAHVRIHYENIKEGRAHDYDWIPRTNWLVTTTPYDYRSIMHYRACWTSARESECQDGDGSSPGAVIDPVGTENDKVIGQWDANGISAIDAEEVRLVYGIKPAMAAGATATPAKTK